MCIRDSDYYTIGRGGSSQADSEDSSFAGVAAVTQTTTPAPEGRDDDQFAVATSNTEDQTLSARNNAPPLTGGIA